MQNLMPKIEYKRMDQGKAYLARYLQIDFNVETMMHHNREVEHTFDAYPKMNEKIQSEWDESSGHREGRKSKRPRRRKLQRRGMRCLGMEPMLPNRHCPCMQQQQSLATRPPPASLLGP